VSEWAEDSPVGGGKKMRKSIVRIPPGRPKEKSRTKFNRLVQKKKIEETQNQGAKSCKTNPKQHPEIVRKSAIEKRVKSSSKLKRKKGGRWQTEPLMQEAFLIKQVWSPGRQGEEMERGVPPF